MKTLERQISFYYIDVSPDKYEKEKRSIKHF